MRAEPQAPLRAENGTFSDEKTGCLQQKARKNTKNGSGIQKRPLFQEIGLWSSEGEPI